MANAQAYANKVFNAMRKQKTDYEDLNNAKMDTAAFDADTVATPPAPPAPDLPDSNDIDPTALIALSAERVRFILYGEMGCLENRRRHAVCHRHPFSFYTTVLGSSL